MISTDVRRHDLVGNATAGPFTYQFLIRHKTHLLVYVDGALKTVDTHYTVANVGNESGGTVTFTAGNEPAQDAEIQFLAAEPFTQGSDYINAGSFPAESHEEALDKLTRLMAQLKETLTRVPVLSLPNHYNKSALTLGAMTAGQFARANPTADGLEFAVPTLVPDDLPAGGGNYDHLTVNGSGVVEWAQQVYNFSSGYVNISRYGNDLSAAVTAIGSVTKVNLVITTLLTVSGNVMVPANITFDFRAAGGLSIANGIVVGYAAGSFLVDDIRRQRFFGQGEFNASNLSEVIPDQWGADATGTNDSLAAIRLAIRSLPSTTGGKLKLLTGTYDISDTIEVDRPLIVEGQGQDVTVINMTTSASVQHGFLSVGPSMWHRDYTIKMETPLTTNLTMCAIRYDLDGSGITDERYYEITRVKARGFNIDFYGDGGADRAIVNGSFTFNDMKASGPAANYVGSCCYLNRCQNAFVERNKVDQNSVGEHGMYCFGNTNIRITGNVISNATRNESHMIKCVGDNPVGTHTYGHWVIEDNEGTNCFNGILAELYGAETIRSLKVHHNPIKTTTGGAVTLNGAITISAATNTVMDHVSVRDHAMEDIAQACIFFLLGSGATIKHAVVDGLTVFDWSTDSSGTWAAIVGNTGGGKIKLLELRNIYADGNSNGRTIWWVNGFGGWSALMVEQLAVDYDTLRQTQVTGAEPIPTLNENDTTPSVCMGTRYLVNNTSSTAITKFDDCLAGREYILKFANGNTDLTNGADLIVAGSADWTTIANEDVWRGLCVADNGDIFETGRSDNS